LWENISGLSGEKCRFEQEVWIYGSGKKKLMEQSVWSEYFKGHVNTCYTVFVF